MNLMMIVHILASLFTVVFAVYTFIHIFHRYSLQHRVDKMSRQMAPLIISKTPKQQVITKLVDEGHDAQEASELHDKLSANFAPIKPVQLKPILVKPKQ
jgi:hypothetical protein